MTPGGTTEGDDEDPEDVRSTGPQTGPDTDPGR